MLLALTTNPAIDRTLVVPGFRDGEVTRVTEKRDAAGGKGLNVARVATRIGLPILACAPLGGASGRRIAELAEAEGIPGAWCWMAQGESRTCLLVTDLATEDTLVINEPGPSMAAADWAAFVELVCARAGAARAVAFCGSLMPDVPIAAFVGLVRRLRAEGRDVYVDISGAPLRAALDLPIALLKVNAQELGAALDQRLETPEACLAAARRVLSRGPQAVVVTLGAAGAIVCDDQQAWRAETPPVKLVSAVGSGDSLLAGVAQGLLGGAGLAEALRLGVACGAANAMTLGGGNVRPDDLRRLLGETRLTPIGDI